MYTPSCSLTVLLALPLIGFRDIYCTMALNEARRRRQDLVAQRRHVARRQATVYLEVRALDETTG